MTKQTNKKDKEKFMNKKLKFAIPFAVLAISCGIAAGCDGCNKHEHSYTEWGYNETQHWKECPDDHAKDEINDTARTCALKSV